MLIFVVDSRLVKIITQYQTANYSDFAVLWFPADVPVASYPIYCELLIVPLIHLSTYFSALSNTDCFHPSEATHELFAATIWNRLTAVQAELEQPVPWSDTLTFRCLEESDRFRTKSLLS